MATSLQLTRLIAQLRKERQTHTDAIAALDEVFAQFGISPEPGKRRGRPKRAGKKKVANKKLTKKRGRKKGAKKKTSKKKATTKKTGRRKFRISGEQLVLNFVKKKRSATSAQINAHWKQQGRGGNVGNILTKFVQDGTFKREAIEGERGSRYTAK